MSNSQNENIDFEKDSGMDDCPECSSTMESAPYRVVARCPDCGFRSYLWNPVGWARYTIDRLRGDSRVRA